MTVIETSTSEATQPLARARQLFEFLARAQELKMPRIRDVQSYDHILWLSDLPKHPQVSFEVAKESGPERAVLTLGRVNRTEPPAAPEIVRPWLRSEGLSPDRSPELVPMSDESRESELRHYRMVVEAFQAWLPAWTEWAVKDKIDQQVQNAYRELFNSFQLSTSKPEEYELLIGVGCLAWRSANDSIRRHLLTRPLHLRLEQSTAELVATVAGTGFQLETDMLDPAQIPPAFSIDAFTREAAAEVAHPLDISVVGQLARRMVLGLGHGSHYDDTLERPAVSTQPAGAFAPAIILRRRSVRGLVQLLRDIGTQLATATELPPGLRPLVDPDYQRTSDPDPTPGGLIRVGDEVFQAMPVNARQQQVIANVDAYAQTLVQGPPGTGKTHTAAALITHLLAQGKRVLITAHTDRALKEVRGKLPKAIQPLAVSVVGASRDDTADLKTAVEKISTEAGEFDHRDAEEDIAHRLAAIDELHRERARVYRRLRDSRERETAQLWHFSYTGTLAAIARRVQDQQPVYGWLREFVTPRADAPNPLTTEEALEWLALLRDGDLQHNATEAGKGLLDLGSIPTADQFANLVDREGQAVARVASGQDPDARALKALRTVPDHLRRRLQEQIRQVGQSAAALEHRQEDWARRALTDVRADRRTAWINRASVIGDLCRRVAPLVQQLGHLPNVVVKQGDVALHRHQAQELLVVLEGGYLIKRDKNGLAKVGPFAPRQVKAAAPFLASVTVDGLPAISTIQVQQFLLWLQVEEHLTALDRAWPASIEIPIEDTAHERLDWHCTELAQLEMLIRLGDAIEEMNRQLHAMGLPHPNWTTLPDIEAYALAVDAVVAEEALTAARAPLATLSARTQRFHESRAAAGVIAEISAAILKRDVRNYRDGRARLEELHHVKTRTARRTYLGAQLRRAAPNLAAAVEADPTSVQWTERMQQLPAAWQWAATATWIVGQEQTDVNALQQRLDHVEARIRHEIERLAAKRAWRHAVSPQRLTGTARADLTQYAQLVRRLGRGIGKYAPQQRAEIMDALDRCSTAVPVWIMPIYRIAEQLTVRESMFDVVVVDEASQAGMEAAFLQYLAPKIVVIGDDKQVSPAAVGVDRQQLRDLANQYLRDDRYKASWQDPERSLFDEAKMRYGSMITLVEHRRCVPEIIGFSNRIAYEPEGIRLIPVRQYGSDRLAPIVPVYVADGYEKGSTNNRVNEPEIDAIVDQLEKCLVDPRYDGMTFGVISLLGTTQARIIESRLQQRVPQDTWTTRELRCGDAADFQGSERNVIFLSMVAAPAEERRLSALTRDSAVQRYNVAASRAKDQLWLFHSVQIGDLANKTNNKANKNDMRYQLLDYCYSIANRRDAAALGSTITSVAEDKLVDPFDSLFEQRVFNRVVERGYSVIPQFAADTYRIDLVVIGAQARLAIECDGDRWHGPDRYAADLARQRDLERAGWTFFRIRESEFYVDALGVLTRLWQKLGELDIHAHGQEPDPAAESHNEETGELPAPTDTADGSGGLIPETPPTSAEVGDEDINSDDDPLVGRDEYVNPARETRREPGPTEELPSYRIFWGELPHPVEAPSADVMRGLIEVVAVEGPVTLNRLFFAYVQSSEVQRTGKIIRNQLAQALGRAVRSRHLIADSCKSGVCYRLPDQPEVRRRQLGPRFLADVPLPELAALLKDAASLHGWHDSEEIFRDVLKRIGLCRLNTEAQRILTKALRLASPATNS